MKELLCPSTWRKRKTWLFAVISLIAAISAMAAFYVYITPKSEVAISFDTFNSEYPIALRGDYLEFRIDYIKADGKPLLLSEYAQNGWVYENGQLAMVGAYPAPIIVNANRSAEAVIKCGTSFFGTAMESIKVHHFLRPINCAVGLAVFVAVFFALWLMLANRMSASLESNFELHKCLRPDKTKASSSAISNAEEPDELGIFAVFAVSVVVGAIIIGAEIIFYNLIKGYVPDNSTVIALLLPGVAGGVTPEPFEKYSLYVVALLLVMISLVISALYCRNKATLDSKLEKYQMGLCIGLVSTTFLILLLPARSDVNSLYLDSAIVGNPYKLALAGAVFYISYRLSKRSGIIKTLLLGAVWLQTIIYTIIGAILCYQSSTQLLSIPTTHFTAFTYSIVEAFYGKVPYADFTCQYGSYAYLFVPLLKLLGLTYGTLTGISILFRILSIAAICGVIIKVVRQPFIKALACFCVVYFYNLTAIEGDPYFQYNPVRVLSFAILLYCFVSVCKKGIRWRGVFATSVIAGCSVLINIDSGVVACLAILAGFGFEALCRYRAEGIKAFRYCAGYAIGGIIVAIGLIEGLTLIQTGQVITMAELLGIHTIFYGIGFSALPIAVNAHWNWQAFCVLFGISASVLFCVKCLRRDKYSTVQYSTVQYSTVQYSTVQYSTVRCLRFASRAVQLLSKQKPFSYILPCYRIFICRHCALGG
ncbi:MAG: hypothetical protein LBL96_11070 [Clostridiales bacterium]|nr:hypothetical protein [Clostridiales bacterium]